MPTKTVKYGEKWYHWNSVREEVELLTITAKPLAAEDVPPEVFQELLKMSDSQAVKEI